MRKILLVSDPHFDDKPKNEYRWDLFPQVAKIIKEHDVYSVFILGDLCDAKDHHSAKLVNRLVDGLLSWRGESPHAITILAGNHDGIDGPYFQFMQYFPGVKYYVTPTEINFKETPMTFLPHSRNPAVDWAGMSFKDRMVFAHVTVKNCVTESGFKMEDAEVDPSVFDDSLVTFSGDIHKPQTVGRVEYVGSPYNTRFGDNFIGRVLLVDLDTGPNFQCQTVHLDFPRRLVFDVKSSEELRAETEYESFTTKKAQVKIRMHHEAETLGNWREEKEACRQIIANLGWDLHSYSMDKECLKTQVTLPASIEERKWTDFESFCRSENIPEEFVEVGNALVMEASNEH